MMSSRDNASQILALYKLLLSICSADACIQRAGRLILASDSIHGKEQEGSISYTILVEGRLTESPASHAD